ncbi:MULTISPECIES: ankyrin repeat domain-containing protein [Burkholderia]|uniref:ankyrin repeat domain-containing protein n=1 Tax=Burkholderia TaxID=32008 RepID=UPI000F0A95AB|nr:MULTISPECIES: ankyrin repeat domain-containing protein [Burkholderia]
MSKIMKKSLGFCSLGVAGLALAIALVLWITDIRLFSPDAQVGRYLAICTLAFGNLIVLVLNGIHWWRYGAPPWFRCVVVTQGLLALLSVTPIVRLVSDRLIQSYIDAKVDRVDKAIQADDIGQFKEAREACGTACTGNGSLDWELHAAARYDALRVATELVRMSAKVDDRMKDADLKTCEGLILQEDSALTLAVAHDNAAMIKVLLPASDASNRRQALWTAARLDRLDIVQLLVQAGAPLDLDVYGNIRDGDNSALVAAAQGAAVHVGQWLIETRHMSVKAGAVMFPDYPDPWSPLLALYYFVHEVAAPPRTRQFLDMLVKHGADRQVVKFQSDEFLTDAVDHELKNEARFFMEAGAKLDPEDTDRRRKLDKVLAGPEKARDIDPVFFTNCIKN